jgi:hypothetical protein
MSRFEPTNKDVVGSEGMAADPLNSHPSRVTLAKRTEAAPMLTKQLRHLWLTIAAMAACSTVAARADAADPPTKELLDELLKEYKLYELPMPPKDAPLVRYSCDQRFVRGGMEITERYFKLGFLVKPAKGRDPAELWSRPGQTEYVGRGQEVKAVEATSAALKGVESAPELQIAIVCHSRGWTDLAAAILEKNKNADTDSAIKLARSAWHYWTCEFMQPETDRGDVASVLKIILKRHKQAFGEDETAYLKSLELSLGPDKWKPGTIGALVDDLLDVNTFESAEYPPHPAYTKLARRGFDAVPTLIASIDDERLTRTAAADRVGWIACHLLRELAGYEVNLKWLEQFEGRRPDKAEVEKWWAEAKKVGEEKYFVEHVLDGSKGGNLLNRLMLEIIGQKCPQRLPALYRRALGEQSESCAGEVAFSVANSSLSRETKREVLLKGTHAKSLQTRLYAIGNLRNIDPGKSLELLLSESEKIPKVPNEEFWRCPETEIAVMAHHWNEPAAWTALEKTAKRVDVGLRVEFLGAVRWPEIPAARKATLGFLFKFLDDTELRVASGPKYDGPFAGFQGFDRIEVRNFAAHEIARMLDLDTEPKPNWSDDQWAKLRDDVRKALAKEGIK